MSKIKDGGPAFPIPRQPGEHCGYPGVTLRDWFAGRALPAVMTDHYESEGGLWVDGVARNAYQIADAMLRARDEVQS